MMSSFDTLGKLVATANSNPSLREELKGWGKAFQFKTDVDSYYVVFNADGTASISRGELSGATATMTAPDALMDDIFSGRQDGVRAYFMGKLKISGDLMQSQRLVSVLKKAGV